ncbi:hypothetical protein M8J75_013274 [Diaphorina citri]|nr:hypothetical protein M8J75_013274 [Diaphorina citri]
MDTKDGRPPQDDIIPDPEKDFFRDTPVRYLGYANEAWHSTEHNAGRVAKIGVDALLWQSLASVAVPGLAINRICYLSRALFARWRHGRVATVVTGLVSIPCVIHPIDWAVTEAMDLTVRPYLLHVRVDKEE